MPNSLPTARAPLPLDLKSVSNRGQASMARLVSRAGNRARAVIAHDIWLVQSSAIGIRRIHA